MNIPQKLHHEHLRLPPEHNSKKTLLQWSLLVGFENETLNDQV